MVLVQKWPFFQLFFQAIQASKMSFTMFQTKKTPLQAIKTRSSKSQKIDIFPMVFQWFFQWLTHGFRPKIAFFRIFFFWAIQARKMSFTIFQKKKTPFWAIKTRSSKSRKNEIFLKGLTNGFGPKIAIFLIFLFLREYKLGNCLLR